MPKSSLRTAKSLDLSHVGITDIHCFAFPAESKLQKEKVDEMFSLGGPTVSSVPAVNESTETTSANLALFVNLLSKYLQCSSSLESVLHARNSLVRKKGLRSYVSKLFKNVGIGTLCLDDGLYPMPLEQLEHIPCTLHKVARIEPMIKLLLEDKAIKSYSDLVEKFETELEASVRSRKAIAFKSVIAYRSGLDIDPHDKDEAGAKKDFSAILDGISEFRWFGPVVPKLRNALLIRAMTKAEELGVFFEIHTGLGDTDIVGSKCNPILLQELLKEERVRGTTTVLIHGGYPYTIEAAWLARVFPNVSIELSTPFPPIFALPLSKERFLSVLSIVPPERILYGSDCFGFPELYWLSAMLSKRALSEAFVELMRKDMLNSKGAMKQAELIFSDNAKRLVERSNSSS